MNSALDEIYAELLPADKVLVINDLKSRVGPTMMIGDGMNDAPALATADVGISMGVSGSAVATETSHITLMSNDLRKVLQAVRLARRTHQTILVNIILSIVTKTAVLGLAFAGYPLLWAAVLADVGTCLLVILHSMMLLREKNVKTKKNGCCGYKKSSNSPCCLPVSNRSHKPCTKSNCCDLEAQVKHCDSPSKSNFSNCCGAKDERSNADRVCKTSCHDDPAVEAKPNSCRSNCCDKPAKGKGSTTQGTSHSHSHNSESHSYLLKQEIKQKENSCQGEHMKKTQNRGSTSLERGCCVESRGSGGCCGKSYDEEVARKEGCGNGCCENAVEFPEIITE